MITTRLLHSLSARSAFDSLRTPLFQNNLSVGLLSPHQVQPSHNCFSLGHQHPSRSPTLASKRVVVFVREPKEFPYGTVAVFLDLYGNMWDLLQPTQSHLRLRNAGA